MKIRLPLLLFSGVLTLLTVAGPTTQAEACFFRNWFGGSYSTYYGGSYSSYYGGPYSTYYGSPYASYYAAPPTYYAPTYSAGNPCCNPCNPCGPSCCPTGCGPSGCGLTGCGPSGCPSGNCTLNYAERPATNNDQQPTPVNPNKTYREDPMEPDPETTPPDGFGPRRTQEPPVPDEDDNFQPPMSREDIPAIPVTPKEQPVEEETPIDETFSVQVKRNELRPLDLDEQITVNVQTESVQRMYLQATYRNPSVQRQSVAISQPWEPETQKVAGLNQK